MDKTVPKGHKTLFLDRDGVININHGYVGHKENFDFIPGIFELCRHAKAKGYSIAIVTNQAGIARGYYTVDDFHHLTRWMRKEFIAHHILIDQVMFSPYHPKMKGRYGRASYCRKPQPGMFLKAQAILGSDFSQSILVGDSMSDIEAAQRVGIKKCILFKSNSIQYSRNCWLKPASGMSNSNPIKVKDLRQIISLL